MLGVVAAILLSYLIGSFPSAIVIGRIFFGRDLRTEGSGNAGGTNAFRVFGWKAGLAVSVLDVAKGAVVAIFLSRLIDNTIVPREGAMLVTGLLAVIGHVWTVFGGFRGGKGVATAAGVVMVIAPLGFFAALAAFSLVLMSTGIVSLSSMTAALTLSISILVTTPADASPWLFGFALFATPFIMFTHRANIGRLLRGEEKRFEKVALLRRLFKPRAG
ncbi:MAG: glycerol-3-phosphate 1-O-acyltransferase PlsY [Spirochaetales bacterium]|nr:MAG: glycerol-3-phosphate 1-O-acyltransferase PlsY [Spirochaetales bacterium]